MPHNYGLDNTVNSKNQVLQDKRLVLDKTCNTSYRVLFIGNSITLHDIAPAIGWYGHWGMAASAQDKDYVHVTMQQIRRKIPDATCAILQAADWERTYESGGAFYTRYRELVEWTPDVIVLRLGENIPDDSIKPESLHQAIIEMMRFFSSAGNPLLIVTSMFWPHNQKDAIFQKAADTLGAAYVRLADLGEQADMMALGLFEHKGVAAHPGDAGMREIASRISAAISPRIHTL